MRVSALAYDMFEVVHLTFPSRIFSVSVKLGACYITGQWVEFRLK